MTSFAERDAPTGVPAPHVVFTHLVTAALEQEQPHLLLDYRDATWQPLETAACLHAPLLLGDAVLLSVAELEAYWAFLEFTGLTRALVEIRALEPDLLELRTLEW